MKLEIDYLAASREAIITTNEAGRAWALIYRACQDHADSNLVQLFDKSIVLPWYSFLLAREAIGYYVAKEKIDVVFSEAAKVLLRKAVEKKKSYERAVQSEELTEEELNEKLTSAGFKRTLTPKQIQNVKKLGAITAGATFSVPGAGKTTEALAFFCCHRRNDTKLLIVCPKNAFAVWEEQIAKIFEGRKINVERLIGGIYNIQGILKTIPDVCLITYQQLAVGGVENLIADYIFGNDVFVFLDESHRMKKGNAGVIGSALLSIAHLPSVKCILSGTPIPNSVTDLLPQFRFLYPEIEVTTETVKDLIKPVYVRTTKKQLGIPEVTRIKVDIPLSPAQRSLYHLLCSEYARENYTGLTSFDKRKLRSLGKSALTLIQLVSNPSLLARRHQFEHKELLNAVLSEGDSPKLSYVTSRARHLAAQGKKTIIWSSFVQNVELISARLYDLGADFIHGGVEAGSEEDEFTRENKIKRFHDDKSAFVLVANPAACSEGISLHTVCHNAIYLDRNYNAAQYLQSEDRIHRYGLDKNQETVIEILSSPNTIDNSVEQRLTSKVNLMKDILDDPDLNIAPVNYNLDDDNEYFDSGDAVDFLLHLKSENDLI